MFSSIVDSMLFNRYKYYNPVHYLFNNLSHFLEKKKSGKFDQFKNFLENKNVNFFHQLVIFRSLNIVELKL